MRIRLKRQALLELIAQRGLSQNHWAIKLGLSKGHWSGIVNGRHPFPSPRTRQRMLDVFRVPFERLFEMQDGPSGWGDQRLHRALAPQYAIDREIGQGGMGTVYLARDIKHGRQVALKVISPEAVSGIGVKQFLKEIRTGARLGHPNILPVFDSGAIEGYPFLTSQFVPGGSLRDRLRHGPMTLDEIRPIVRGLADALQHAHDRHVLHCDIKPENILLFQRHAYLADFGVAQAVHAEAFEWERPEGLDSSAGTPAYVSPEQASGERHLDGRADVYSLGCTVFEMLTGGPPFVGATTMDVVAQRFISPVPRVRQHAPHVPIGVSQAVQRAMELAPNRRFKNPREFGDAFDQACHHRSAFRETVFTLGYRLSAGWNTRQRFIKGNWANMLDTIRFDLWHALRGLRASWGFTLLTLILIGLGVGASTGIFTVVNGVLLKPLPFREPARLVTVWEFNTNRQVRSFVSPPNVHDWRQHAESFEGLTAFVDQSVIWNVDGRVQRVNGLAVSPDFFATLGVQPALGRPFRSDQSADAQLRDIVLSHQFWNSRFGGDPSVVGRSIDFEEGTYQVVGVLPDTFRFPGDPSVLLPLHFPAPQLTEPMRGARYINVIARLLDGVTLPSAEQAMRSLADQLRPERPNNEEYTVSLVPMRDWVVEDAEGNLWLAFGAAGLLALIASVNVGGLVLARSARRRTDLAVRSALGASTGRIARHLVMESLLLGVGGGILGLILGTALMKPLLALAPSELPRAADVAVDGTVVVFAVIVAAAIAVTFGFAPLLHRRTWQSGVLLRAAGGTRAGVASKLRSALILAEIAMAVVLLFGAGAFLQHFLNLRAVNPGFDPNNVVTAFVGLPNERYGTAERQLAFFQELEDVLRRSNQVTAVGLGTNLPLTGSNWSFQFWPDQDAAIPSDQSQTAQFHVVSPDYFAALDIVVADGRSFLPTEDLTSGPVAIVSRHLAERLWPNGSAVGRRIPIVSFGGRQVREIVGVVDGVKHAGLAANLVDEIYVPLAQVPTQFIHIVVRSPGTLQDVETLLANTMASVDPRIPVDGITSMTEIVGRWVAPTRFQMVLLGTFSAIALVLAMVGLYGLIAYLVEGRRREIGIRMALGAAQSGMMWAVLRGALSLTVLGVVFGLVLGVALQRVTQTAVVSVSGPDVWAMSGVVGIVLAVAAVAAIVPARRAASIAPQVAMRME